LLASDDGTVVQTVSSDWRTNDALFRRALCIGTRLQTFCMRAASQDVGVEDRAVERPHRTQSLQNEIAEYADFSADFS
jgi:hypothetical protein